MLGISISDFLTYIPYYIRTYVPYELVHPVIVIRVCSTRYNRLYCGLVCGSDSVHTCTFSINIWELDA